MTKTTLKAIFLALLTVTTVACGDPGDASFDEELELDDEGVFEEVGFGDEAGDDEAPTFIEVPRPVFDQVEEIIFDEAGQPLSNEARPAVFGEELEPVIHELSEEELALIAGVDGQDALIKRIVAGEVLIEDLGNGVVAAEGLSEAEIAELEANGFEIQRGG